MVNGWPGRLLGRRGSVLESGQGLETTKRNGMKLDLEEKGGVSILVLSGQLARGAEKQFREAIDTLVSSGRSKILIDFTEVTFMDSAGIGELVASYRTIGRLGGALKILNPGSKVQDSLTLTNLLPIFEVFEDEEEAVASFAPEQP